METTQAVILTIVLAFFAFVIYKFSSSHKEKDSGHFGGGGDLGGPIDQPPQYDDPSKPIYELKKQDDNDKVI